MNKPKFNHIYYDKKTALWVQGIGDFFTCKNAAEKSRELKYEKLHAFKFYGVVWFANVPKYDFNNLINNI